MSLKIGVLGSKFKDYERKRIIEEIKKLKHDSVKLHLRDVCLSVDKQLSGFYGKTQLKDLDVVIPRFVNPYYRFGLMVMRHLQQMKIPTVNSYRTIKICQNKYLSCLALKKQKIPQPRSFIASSPRQLIKIIRKLENPVIFKLLRGGKGTGVALINNVTEAEDWLGTLKKIGRLIYLQEYIPHHVKEDFRLFVVGDKVVGAMKRISTHGWKTNFSLGNKVISFKPCKKLRHLAIRSAKAVHAELCGVDIMEGLTGYEVIEVNQHPGFKGLEKATGKNIARKIVKFAITKVRK